MPELRTNFLVVLVRLLDLFQRLAADAVGSRCLREHAVPQSWSSSYEFDRQDPLALIGLRVYERDSAFLGADISGVRARIAFDYLCIGRRL